MAKKKVVSQKQSNKRAGRTTGRKANRIPTPADQPASKGGSKTAPTIGGIELTRLEDAVIEVPIVGQTPLIPHRFSEKARRMMPGHPDSDSKRPKQKRKPKEEAEACLYKLGNALAFPATGFKAAMVGACRFFEKPSMTEAKQLFRIEGEGPEQLVKIGGNKLGPREDPVRNANGSADLRYRYYIDGWSATLRIRFVPSRITRDSIVTLVDAAGRGGVGDWRPSAPKSFTGTYGCFRVDDSKEVKDVG